MLKKWKMWLTEMLPVISERPQRVGEAQQDFKKGKCLDFPKREKVNFVSYIDQ